GPWVTSDVRARSTLSWAAFSRGRESSGTVSRFTLLAFGRENAQSDELLSAVAIAVEQPADQRPRRVDRTQVRRRIQDRAGVAVAFIVQDVPFELLLAASGEFRWRVDGGAALPDLRLPLGIFQGRLDDEPPAAV